MADENTMLRGCRTTCTPTMDAGWDASWIPGKSVRCWLRAWRHSAWACRA